MYFGPYMSESQFNMVVQNTPHTTGTAQGTLGAALDRWLGQQDDAANTPRLAHAMSEGKTALKALRERLSYHTIYAEARISYKKFGFIAHELPIDDPAWLGSKEPLPYQSSPIAKLLTMGDIIVNDAIHADSRWDGASSMMVMNHNVYVQMDGIFRANEAYAQPESQAQYHVPRKLLNAKKAIEEIFAERIPLGKLVEHRELLESV